MSTTIRNYTDETILLYLDGVNCGWINSIEGGGISAEVVKEPSGRDYYTKKHLGQPKYEDLLLQIGLSMGKPVYDWIAASWSGGYVRKDVTIFTTGHGMQVKSQRDFFNVLITEVSIPTLGGDSKDPCNMTLRLAPEYSRSKKPLGKLLSKVSKSTPKPWLPANFKLKIDGLDCTKVSRVDAFTVTNTAITDHIGDIRDNKKEPGKLDFPNLRITMAEHVAQTLIDWHKDFVIKGNNDESKEKNGSLAFVAPNLSSELAHINLLNLGLFHLAPEKVHVQQDRIKKIVAELYCERMEFVFPWS